MKKVLLFVTVLFWLFSFLNVNAAIDKSLEESANSAFSKAYDYYSIWYEEQTKGNDKKAIELLKKSQNLMEKYYSDIDFTSDDSVNFMLWLYTSLSYSYINLFNYKEAITVSDKWLLVEWIDKFPETKAMFLNNKWYALFMLWRFTESLKKYNEALKFDSELEVLVNNKNISNLISKAIPWMYENWLTTFSNVTSFRYQETINREQASKFFVEFAKKYLDIPEKDNSCKFKDLKSADPTLQKYLTLACRMDLLKGSNNLFSPKAELTYGQVVTIISRMLDWLKYDSTSEKFRENHLTSIEDKWISYIEGIDWTAIAQRWDVAVLIYNTFLFIQQVE